MEGRVGSSAPIPPRSPSSRCVIVLALALWVGIVGAPSLLQAQFMYLDANGDGISTWADSLNVGQAETSVSIYLDTSHRQDGSLSSCDSGAEPLSIFSYVINLAAIGGTVAYSEFVNLQDGMTTAFARLIRGMGIIRTAGVGQQFCLRVYTTLRTLR